ncbi:MAG: efflux RND transporter permease subunit [Candidatus Izemoplasma sp.]
MQSVDFSKYIFKYKKIIFLLVLSLTAYGIFSYFEIPKQDMPEFDIPYSTIIISSYGNSASDIDQYIAKEIYEISDDISGILELDITSYDNYAVLNFELEFGHGSSSAKYKEIYNAVSAYNYDLEINEFYQYPTFESPLAIYAISGDYDISTLIEISEDIAADFKNIDGIKSTSITHNNVNQINVEIDLELLNIYGMTFEYIYYKVNSNLSDLTLGNITTAQGSLLIQSEDLITNISDIENLIIIDNYNGLGDNLLLKDISTIARVNTSNIIYEMNGKETVFISIFSEQAIDITKLDNSLDNVSEFYEDDVEINQMVYLIDDVNRQLNNIFINLLITLGIVFLVMVIGINLRISLINMICTVVIVFGTIGILNFLGYSLEKLSIVGIIISIGILVDNMVVIGESISSNIDSGMDNVTAVKESIRKNSIPVLSSSLTTIAAFFSISLLSGYLGAVIRSMPITVMIMISLSYLVSMTLLPLLSVLLFKKSKPRKPSPYQKYELKIKKVISAGISFPVLLGTVSLFLLTFLGYTVLNTQGIDIYPIDEKKAIYIDINNTESFNINDTYLMYQELESIIKDDAEVIDYFSSIGGNLPTFHFSSLPMSATPNNSRVYLTLDLDVSQIPRYLSTLQAELDLINDNYTVNFLELSPPEHDLQIIMLSSDLELLDIETKDLIDEILALDNISYSVLQTNVKIPKYYLSYNIDAMNEHFITKDDINKVVSLNANGFYIDTLDPTELPIIYIHPGDSDVDYLMSLFITSEITTLTTELSNYISFSIIEDYTMIRTVEGEYTITLELDTETDYDPVALKDDVKAITKDFTNDNITIDYSGVNKAFEDVMGSIITASIVSLLLIYFFMFLQFNSFIKPLIIYITIPLSFAGSLLFMLIFDSLITATSMIGIISLIGITVNTGILLIEYIDIERKSSNKDLKGCIVDAVYKRTRAIVLTSLTTILGLIPLLVNGGDFFNPLAITFMGGIFTSAILTIFLVPGLYYKIYKRA